MLICNNVHHNYVSNWITRCEIYSHAFLMKSWRQNISFCGSTCINLMIANLILCYFSSQRYNEVSLCNLLIFSQHLYSMKPNVVSNQVFVLEGTMTSLLLKQLQLREMIYATQSCDNHRLRKRLIFIIAVLLFCLVSVNLLEYF